MQGRQCECDHGFTGDDCEQEAEVTIATSANKWSLKCLQMCGGQFDSPAGFIDFPVGAGTFYSHSISCDYSIHVQPGMVVSLAFTQFR